MTLHQIEYVLAIVKAGTYRQAAQDLYISQPSLTNAIQELEQELGITIFRRTKKGAFLTDDGLEFITYARQLWHQVEAIEDKYLRPGGVKKKFGVSCQHYSFAVKVFVEMVKECGFDEYEFAIRETKTKEVIEDVKAFRSEVGILYLSDFNRTFLNRQLDKNNLEFHKLVDCRIYAYLWKGHPLAAKDVLDYADLDPYPCLSFEQGESGSFYFAEEIAPQETYPQSIKVNDRATMLNLMKGLGGYTLCSGIISSELNGPDFVAVPLKEAPGSSQNMEIGWIGRKDAPLSLLGDRYVRMLQAHLIG
jgi:DNA-binding transcriptional LysR family regulator